MASRANVDLRDSVGPDVLDQGERPTCVTFAVSACHEAHRSGAGRVVDHLAPESLWHYCHTAGTASGRGLTVVDVGSALSTSGQPLLIDWPYNASLGSGTEPPPVGLVPAPWNRAQLRPVNLRRDMVEDELEDELAAGLPVMLVLEVTDEFYVPDKHGIVAMSESSRRAGRAHAVACVGAFTDKADVRYFLIKNSWGEKWGAGGYGWVSMPFIREFVYQAAKVTAV